MSSRALMLAAISRKWKCSSSNTAFLKSVSYVNKVFFNHDIIPNWTTMVIRSNKDAVLTSRFLSPQGQQRPHIVRALNCAVRWAWSPCPSPLDSPHHPRQGWSLRLHGAALQLAKVSDLPASRLAARFCSCLPGHRPRRTRCTSKPSARRTQLFLVLLRVELFRCSQGSCPTSGPFWIQRVAIINANFKTANAATTNVQNHQTSNPPTPLPT